MLTRGDEEERHFILDKAKSAGTLHAAENNKALVLNTVATFMHMGLFTPAPQAARRREPGGKKTTLASLDITTSGSK